MFLKEILGQRRKLFRFVEFIVAHLTLGGVSGITLLAFVKVAHIDTDHDLFIPIIASVSIVTYATLMGVITKLFPASYLANLLEGSSFRNRR